jgi:hypothetical protein
MMRGEYIAAQQMWVGKRCQCTLRFESLLRLDWLFRDDVNWFSEPSRPSSRQISQMLFELERFQLLKVIWGTFCRKVFLCCVVGAAYCP